MYGMEICDDPFDPHRELGKTDPITEIHIRMEFGNRFVYLKTRAPTLEEFHTLLSIKMTNEAHWDPSKVGRRQLLWEEEERRALIGNVRIDPHTISRMWPEQPQLKMDESEFDICSHHVQPSTAKGRYNSKTSSISASHIMLQ
jgi:hypothetical protein